MSSITTTAKSTSTGASRRKNAEIREEYEKFVELYRLGLTLFEIMRKLKISKVQYKKYFADAIESNLIALVKHEYGTCAGKHLPEAICSKMGATSDDLIRFEANCDNSVILRKIDM